MRMKIKHQTSNIKHPSSGFSLIEVTLAVFMIGLGVLTLFALFPAGLRQSESAMQDTHLGLFADKAFSGIRAEASAIVDWDDWNDINRFIAAAVNSVELMGQSLQTGAGRIDNIIQDDVHISYHLDVGPVAGKPDLRYANLKAHIGDTYNAAEAQWFYTEFFYVGLE